VVTGKAWNQGMMLGREANTKIEVCFISVLYTLLRLLKARAEGAFVFQDIDIEVKMKETLLRILRKLSFVYQENNVSNNVRMLYVR